MNPLRTALVLIGFQRGSFMLHGALRDFLEHSPAPAGPDTVALVDPLDGRTCVVLAIDLDGFDHVNDPLVGRDARERVLVEVGRRLRVALRSSDTVSGPDFVNRLDAEVFFVVCEDVKATQAAAAVAARVAQAISAPIDMDGRTVTVDTGTGIALDTTWQGLEATIRDARDTLRQAKKQGSARDAAGGGGGGGGGEEAAATDGQEAMNEVALRRALDEGQLRVVYQPKFSVATGQVTGVEALLRWEHRQLGTVPPNDFIPLAERSGLIVPIGAWVLEEACRQAKHWATSFDDRPPVPVSVNVSGRQFGTDIVGTVARALDGARLAPALLYLEVTETIVMADVDAAISTLQDLKTLGVSVSIDDFGTGYSSLAYLRRLPLDELKVDKSFVDGLGHDPVDTALVAAVVGMAHALDLVVVAEGVETEDQWHALRTMGCEYAQGYYYARPGPPQALDALLAAEAEASWAGHQGERTATAHPDGTYRRPLVVIADDTPDVLQLARLSLTTAGFEVREATTGREAIALVKQLLPDCVILDVMMPDMDGLEVCRSLRSHGSTADCTIVILTAASSPNSKVAAFAAEADDYIVKPFSPRDLVSRVRAAMNRRA